VPRSLAVLAGKQESKKVSAANFLEGVEEYEEPKYKVRPSITRPHSACSCSHSSTALFHMQCSIVLLCSRGAVL